MLSREKTMEKLLEFEENELKFKELHMNHKRDDLLKEFREDFDNFKLCKDIKKLFLADEEWYSLLINYHYPRVFLQPEGIMMKRQRRYHLPFLHVHEHFELSFVIKGECIHTVNSEEIIVKEGEFVIITPGNIHSVYAPKDDCIIINLLVNKEVMKRLLKEFPNEKDIVMQSLKPISGIYGAACVCFSDKTGFVSDSIIRLCMNLLDNSNYQNQFEYAVLTEIFCFCLRENCVKKIYEETVNCIDEILDIISYIKGNYRNITLDDLANQFNFNSQYMCRLIKKNTGKTFKQLLTDFRMREACTMLQNTSLRIIDIANEVGYSSEEHFIRVFTIYNKLTPSEYRKVKKNQ